jgi:acetyltransferase-like isoleucine patch superfamily enzyme
MNPTLWQASIRDVQFGSEVICVEPCNLYGCSIGDKSFVGPFVEIQQGAIIGKRCRVQVTIGDDCFIGHGVMFVNDLFKRGGPSGKAEDWKPTHIGNNVNIGSNATILPVSITDRVVIGAGSVVTRDITEPGIYAGNPARKIRTLP